MGFLPKQENFFEQLNQQTRIISQAAKVLIEGVKAGNSHLKVIAPRISQLEREGDEVVHDVFRRLNLTFITPIDPEDIHSLCSHLDDVLDGIEEVAFRIVAYKIDPLPEYMVQICEYVYRCAVEVARAVAVLDNNKAILDHCIEINRLEDEVDQIVRRAIIEMFEAESDPIRVIKLKEVYDLLEATVDSCEDVSDVLQNVVVKNS